MAKSVADLLREAAAAIEEQSRTTVPATATDSPRPATSAAASTLVPADLTPRGTGGTRGEVLRLFRPYNRPHTTPGRARPRKTFTHKFFCLAERRQEEMPNPAARHELENAGLGGRSITFPNKFCSGAEFTAVLLNNFQALSDCGGYQLLRTRGSSRSRALVKIDCPANGYTPVYLSTVANIGQATLYVRPLQKDIDLETLPQADEGGTASQYMVACLHCGQDFFMDVIQDHVDACEVAHATSSTSSLSASTHAPSATSSPSTSTHATPSTSSSGVALSLPTAGSLETGDCGQSGEEWKQEPDLKEAGRIFRDFLLQNAEEKPTLAMTMDMNISEEDRERATICFYKQPNIDWTRPFEVRLKGDNAMGDGVKRNFFSSFISKISTGLHLDFDNTGGKTLFFVGEADHQVPSTSLQLIQGDLFRVVGRFIGHSFLNGGPLVTGLSQCLFPLLCGTREETPVPLQLNDCPDTDVTEMVSLLENQAPLTTADKGEINKLAISWDMPPVTETNRRWLAQQLLHHGVITRREKQIKQIQTGLKDTGVFRMLKERPELMTVLFPRAWEARLEPEMVLERIVWPQPDSDEEEMVGDICSATAYLRKYIETASSSDTQELMEFWTGWAVLPDSIHVEVEPDLSFPVASTCFNTLKIPSQCESFTVFKERVEAAVSSTKFGFERV